MDKSEVFVIISIVLMMMPWVVVLPLQMCGVLPYNDLVATIAMLLFATGFFVLIGTMVHEY